jgi:arginase family enzyme
MKEAMSVSAKNQPAALSNNGIAKFCKASYVLGAVEIDADTAILGVPFDNTASMRSGCRQAHFG